VLSDQLSDYEGEDGYTTAHVDIRSSRSARDFGRASGMLHTEEVTGSNPVSPTRSDKPLTSRNAAVRGFFIWLIARYMPDSGETPQRKRPGGVGWTPPGLRNPLVESESQCPTLPTSHTAPSTVPTNSQSNSSSHGLPAVVRINWPRRPTTAAAAHYPAVAAAIVKIIAESATALARHKAGGL
jgi:hypothetical protein